MLYSIGLPLELFLLGQCNVNSILTEYSQKQVLFQTNSAIIFMLIYDNISCRPKDEILINCWKYLRSASQGKHCLSSVNVT